MSCSPLLDRSVLRLIRQLGMAAFSLSAVLQLLAVNLVAIFWFGEKVGWVEGDGSAWLCWQSR